MKVEITNCTEDDVDLIYHNLTESVFQSVPELRHNKHFKIHKKIVDENGDRSPAGGRIALMENGGDIQMNIAANNEREYKRIMSLLDGVGEEI